MSGLLLGVVLSVCNFLFLWLPYFYDLFLLVLIEAHTKVDCLILPLFPRIRYTVVEHTSYHVSLCSVFTNIGHAYILWARYYRVQKSLPLHFNIRCISMC